MQPRLVSEAWQSDLHRERNLAAVARQILESRLRQVRANVVPNIRRATLQNEILNQIKKRLQDQYRRRPGLRIPSGRKTSSMSKSIHANEYVCGSIHTQGVWFVFLMTADRQFMGIDTANGKQRASKNTVLGPCEFCLVKDEYHVSDLYITVRTSAKS